ncbi:MAG: T9SS type A sorting domain-containing protein [Bacteroidia bacterium]|nr:T9SS type A sorting domain-containing protein [Bacteroidia bacterium]
MKRFLLILSFLAVSGVSMAQSYIISQYNNQTITTCSGTFYDSGGGGSNYSSNENYTVTFCPQTAGTSISLNFTLWTVASGASLQLYDGPSTSSWSGATFSAGGFSPVGMPVTATLYDTTGCLTFTWTSGSGADVGWQATVSCVTPCQTVMSGLVSTSPAANDSGFIDICPGTPIHVIGTGLFPQNNTIYNQSNSTSTFVWNYGTGLIDSSASNMGTIVYSDTAGHIINLTVYDSLGCKSTNIIGQRVRISTHPKFTGTIVSNPEICHGDTVSLEGIVHPTLFHLSPSLMWGDTTFLPDGYGSYTTTLTYDVFAPGQTLTNINQLISICAVMEHSYLGDLNMTVTCPNGTVVTLKHFPGCNGQYLGIPIDIDTDLSPGTGWEYCWTPNPTYGIMNNICATYTTMPAGSYTTYDPITNFIGCPLNGDWTFTATDNWLSDNGYIFTWGVTFDPSILPVDFDYTPEFVHYSWDAPSSFVLDTIQTTNHYTVSILPDTGSYNFTLTATDNYGCSYDTTVHLLVHPTWIVNFPPDTTLCSDATLLLDASNNGQNIGAQYIWHNSYGNTTSSNSWWLVDKPGTYWVEIPNIVMSCGHEDTITVHYNNLGLDLGLDLNNVCSSTPVTLNATTPLAGYPSVTYHWSTGATTPTITVTATGTYSVSVTRGACTETDTKTVNFVNPLSINLGSNKFLCQGDSVLLDAGFYQYATYLWSVGLNTQTVHVTNPGTYMVSVTNGCGTYKDTIVVTSINTPVVHLGNDTAICSSTQLLHLNALYTGPDQATYHWSTNAVTPAILASATGNYCVTVTNQCGAVSDCLHLQGDTPLTINLGTDSTVCPGYILNSGYPDCSYYWSDGETTQSILVNQSDSYMVDVTNTCGSYSDAVNLQVIQLNVNLGPDVTICPGSNIILDAQNPGCMYSWSNGQTTQTIDVISGGEFSVAVTNQCQTKFDTVNVHVFDTTIDLGNDTSICEGSSLTIDAQHPGSVYHWSTGATTQSINAVSSGTYYVTVTHTCGTLNDSIHVNVNPVPVVNLGLDTVMVGQGQSITLDAGPGFVSYHWSTGASTQTVTVQNESWYYVTVTDANGCKGKGKIFLKILGIEINEPEVINIYPNPAKDVLIISSEKLILTGIEMYSSLGQLIKSERIESNKFYLNTTEYAEGMYFIKVTAENGDLIVRPVSIIK